MNGRWGAKAKELRRVEKRSTSRRMHASHIFHSTGNAYVSSHAADNAVFI